MVNGRIIIMKRYNRSTIRSMSDTLFVFGDNLARLGYGGQAAEARGELNSVGIPTKYSPSRCFDDDDASFNTSKEPIVKAFVVLAQHLLAGHDIVWPADGVGTGLAKLPECAPLIFEGIEKCRKALFNMASGIIVYT